MSYKVIKLKEIDSTHKLALRMIDDKSAFECIIVSDTQTNGVGRCGREWESTKGNLNTSIIRKIPINVNISQLSLAIATIVHRSIEIFIPPKLKNNLYLHWPNDVYYKNKKISGILLAVVGEWVVISIGINVYPVSTNTAISLNEIVDDVTVSNRKLLRHIVHELDLSLMMLRDGRFPSVIKDYWLKRMVGINSNVTIKNGKDKLFGVIKGIDNSGRLILDCNKKILYISSGDMFLNEDQIMVNYD